MAVIEKVLEMSSHIFDCHCQHFDHSWAIMFGAVIQQEYVQHSPETPGTMHLQSRTLMLAPQFGRWWIMVNQHRLDSERNELVSKCKILVLVAKIWKIPVNNSTEEHWCIGFHFGMSRQCKLGLIKPISCYEDVVWIRVRCLTLQCPKACAVFVLTV